MRVRVPVPKGETEICLCPIIEAGYLRRALQKSGGSYTRAAQFLKMSLRSFRYKMQKYGIDKD